MQKYEQLVFGPNQKDDATVRSVLAQSPGMGADVKEEVVRLCENWGTAPPLGLEHPALLSFPLKATMPSLRGKLYAVIRVGRGLAPLFHAKVLTDQSYTSFLRNPYTFGRSVEWIEQWQPGLRLESGEAKADPSQSLISPPAGPDDMGLVDEALLKLLIEGRLHLPIERPGSESDRCLCLLIACLPENDRKDLRFASFTTHEANDYQLAAMAADNCHFSGWRRLMSAWIASDYLEETEAYIAAIREYLPKGDLSGLTRVTMRVSPRPGRSGDGSGPDIVAATNTSHQEIPRPQPVKKPMVRPATPPAAGVRASSPAPGVRPSLPSGPRPLTPPRPMGPGPASGPGPLRPASPAEGSLTTKKPPVRRKSSARPSRRRPRWSLLRVGAVALVLAAAVFTGLNWMDGKTLAESLQWARITDWMPDQIRTERAPTLLEVVDVGMVYDNQLKLVTGQGALGLKPSEDQGRRKAMGRLRDAAAQPLQEQVRLFNKLAADGIQQGSRPDREIQRMGSLADQGEVLKNEINRLELAYYSLASAVYWQDLSSLDDRAVKVRRDSLLGVDKRALEDVGRNLWTVDPGPALAEARDNVNGMASLLELFQAKRWSADWEQELARAAGLVSPRASTMTRAYRNSAFTFVRIKKAERKAANRNLPFRADFADGAWPSAEVAAALPALRAQTRVFGSNQAPPVLDAILDLYVDLKSPATLAKRARTDAGALDDLRNNRAYRFHPQAYENFLGRIRYEAILAAVPEAGAAGSAPAHLGSVESTRLATAFRDTMKVTRDPMAWEALATDLDDEFLAAWAAYQGQKSGARLARSRKDFDAAWVEARKSVVELQTMVKAGENWSASWQEVHGQTQTILREYGHELAADPERSGRVDAVANLAAALAEPVSFGIRSMTVRLEQGKMTVPSRVRVEVTVLPGNTRFLSEALEIGPSAPAGTGWVGTAALDWSGRLDAHQHLAVRVLTEDGQKEILTTTCPSLVQGGGAGVLNRPLAGDGGSVKLRVDPGYWASLRVPDLGVIF